MGFLSRSSSGKHYKNGHQGSNHYQKKGLLGNLFDIIASRSHSHGYYNNYGNQNNNAPVYNQPTANQNMKLCSRCNSQIPEG